MLDAKRCWRAELIISELITNASRHAFTSQAGRISVRVETAAGQIICGVSDDGSPTATLKRGLGSELLMLLRPILMGTSSELYSVRNNHNALLSQVLDEPPTANLQEVKHAYSQSRRGQDATVAN